ncbi:hypothetical protein VB796_09530 [Arcicella sp. LKC2W]|uniref:hypothetical protein n=1 Tax=Arcicella sp. LKC2W TaxID=2984198 RepID=UPI002B21F6C3|nr:hypothetical protein [Arcicella sp. LKC2W]MEA5459278.1 hypothetical protein [Arcicella sp. LKC2W]
MVKLALTVISLFLFFNCGYSQKERHKFWIYQDSSIPKMGIEGLLKKGIGPMKYTDINHCEMSWAVFYFTVDYKGRIKDFEIDQNGNLDTNVINIVKRNIYATEGLWHIPKHTSKNEVCKFAYPYFRSIPDDTTCTDFQNQLKSEKGKFIRILSKLSGVLEKEKGGVYVIIPRHDRPGEY